MARQPIFVSQAAPDCKARTTSSTFALQAAPFLAAQQMFLVPLDRYEKGVQDALLGGGPLDAETAQALGLAPDQTAAAEAWAAGAWGAVPAASCWCQNCCPSANMSCCESGGR